MERVAEISVVRVALVREGRVAVRVEGADDAVEVVRWLIGDRDRETFLVLCLDTKLAVNAAHIAAVGSLDHCPLHPREVFKAALLANAASVILAHNHPSGDPRPSPDDRAMTRRLCEADEILGIPVQDHVIVGHGRAYSFRMAGDMPGPSAPGGRSALAQPGAGVPRSRHGRP